MNSYFSWSKPLTKSILLITQALSSDILDDSIHMNFNTVNNNESTCYSNPIDHPFITFAKNKSIDILKILSKTVDTHKLFLKNCSVVSLSDKFFDLFCSLSSINLSKNRIKCLPTNFSFASYHDLSHIDLSNNEIEFLHENFGVNMKNLEILFLEQNKLTKAPSSFDKYFTNLHLLNLSGNSINSFNENFGSEMKSLKSLFLEQNNLSTVPISFNSCFSNLSDLELSRNSIEVLNEDFGMNMQNFCYAFLNHNRLSTLPKSFNWYFSNLNYLDVSHNDFYLLEEDFGSNMKNLEYLFLSHNKLTTLPKSFNHCFLNLCHLDLSNNRIEKLDKNFGNNFKNLNYLNLSNNKIDNLFCSFESKSLDLNELDLSFNKLSAITENFCKNLKSIQSLNLSSNSLEEIHSGFGDNMKCLTNIDLSGNNLKNLPLSFIGLADKCRSLDITNNLHFQLEGIEGISLGLEELKKYYGSKLKYGLVVKNEKSFNYKYNQFSLVWNFEDLKLVKSSSIDISKNEYTFNDFVSILEKFKNFKIPVVSKNATDSSQEQIVDLFSNIESIELEPGDERLETNLKIKPCEFFGIIQNYINKLFHPNFVYSRWAMNKKYIQITLDLLYGIFSYLNLSNNPDEIQSYLLIILSAIIKCDLRQYEEFERLYFQTKGKEFNKNSLIDFINYHISHFKDEVFESVFLITTNGQNCHILDYWHKQLKDKLGLREKQFVPKLNYILGDDPFESNEFKVLDAFFSKFTPETTIEYLVNKINQELIRYESLFNDLLAALTFHYIKDSTKLKELGIDTDLYIYPKEANFDLVKEFLKLQGLLIENCTTVVLPNHTCAGLSN